MRCALVIAGCSAATLLLLLLPAPAGALNKQGARTPGEEATPTFNVSGYAFAGVFLFNPTYAARPGNSGLALGRFGLHLDVDLFRRWLTVSYDENTFTDGSDAARGWYYPSEDDHIVGVLSTIPLARQLSLTLAMHYEIDLPAYEARPAFVAAHPEYQRGYSQSYVDAYARATVQYQRVSAYAALGVFVYGPSYAARPDNSGVALLRYVLHGEVELLPWLIYRLDLNFFTDRDEGPLTPTEADILSTVAVRWRSLELRLDGEADLNLGRYPFGAARGHAPSPYAGFNQLYLATVLQWSFDLAGLRKQARTPARPVTPFPF